MADNQNKKVIGLEFAQLTYRKTHPEMVKH